MESDDIRCDDLLCLRPYYVDEWTTIWCGDAREILPTLAAGMVCLTDQPYGTGWVRGGGDVGKWKARHDKPEWDVWNIDWLQLLNRPKRIAAFCPVARCEELCAALPMPAVLHYRKTNVRPNGIDREPIVCSPPPTKPGWKKDAYNGDMPLHPCQKPMPIMTWLVDLVSDESDTILDPHMGSGTTLLAAKELGRRAVGIDVNEEYCQIAATRLAQEQLPLVRHNGGGQR